MAEFISHPTGVVDLREASSDNSTLQTIQSARQQLVEAELALRDLWYETVDTDPAVAVRINSAVRLCHLAAEALSPTTVI